MMTVLVAVQFRAGSRERSHLVLVCLAPMHCYLGRGDLPLRIAVRKDEHNPTWARYDDLDQLARRDGVKDRPLIDQMKAGFEQIVREAASALKRLSVSINSWCCCS